MAHLSSRFIEKCLTNKKLNNKAAVKKRAAVYQAGNPVFRAMVVEPRPNRQYSMVSRSLAEMADNLLANWCCADSIYTA